MTNDKTYLIIYHKEDNDGHFSAAIILNYLFNVLKVSQKNVFSLGCNYEDMSNLCIEDDNHKTQLDKYLEKYDTIIMTDISFNDISVMKKIYDIKKKNFIWIDHHAPVIKESFKLKFDDAPGLRDTNRSAILNAYKFFYDQFDEEYNAKSQKIELLRILSGFDSWTFEREGYTKDFVFSVNQGVSNTFCLKLKDIYTFVHKLLNGEYNVKAIIQQFREAGDMYLKVESNKFENLLKEFSTVYKFDDGKREVPVLFYAGQTFSDMFQSVQDKFEHGAVFKQMKTGRWCISLYNTTDDVDFHCGDYLKKKYGGGGHKGAAGCQISEEQMLDIIKNKEF